MAKTSIDVNSDLFQRLFADPQRMREVIQVICQAAMSQEVEEHVGAQRHERTDGRRGQRNGSKPRTLLTRVGELELRCRRCGVATWAVSSDHVRKWERSERALLVACGEMYFQGVSTRNVREVLETMSSRGAQRMTVSRVAGELDEKLVAFRPRRLDVTSIRI